MNTKNMENNIGFNAKTGQIEDLMESGVVDAFQTTLSSFKSAVSVAATILTAQVITLLPKIENSPTDPFRPYER
jgi:chaperonin GroEL